ncbi:hypothetical protein NEILACOT_04163 [Neisseria lactamica ATCC 23970]|uniref:Uncharacterized protein n=1 Tax=Neisseria lactamica ATCC 23970 TaxID=546265 RepID=D0W9F3_NEILA|nr:hypothetical protein NEILACOT_04163 [Neisseria lactamica ATCC 23970]
MSLRRRFCRYGSVGFFILCFLSVFGFCSGDTVKSGRFDADGKCIRPIHPDGA